MTHLVSLQELNYLLILLVYQQLGSFRPTCPIQFLTFYGGHMVFGLGELISRGWFVYITIRCIPNKTITKIISKFFEVIRELRINLLDAFHLVLVFNLIMGVELVSASKNETGIVDWLCLIPTLQELFSRI